jgi:20S proteasome alpha/beta subunit
MTLIVGIKCKDGIVLGADSAATYGNAFQSTIKQQTSKKLCVIQNQVILGVSGPVGLSQSYETEIEEALHNKGPKQRFKKMADGKKFLKDSMWKHAKPAWEKAEVLSKSIGQQALQAAIHSSVVAFPVANEEPSLVQFTHECECEAATVELPFVSIGSGQPVADPFLAYIRKIFWPRQEPSLDDGILATLWTLSHAIEALPGGVAGPIQIVTLKKRDGEWECHELSESELGEHRQMIAAMEDGMRKVVKETFFSQSTSPIPSPSNAKQLSE